MTTNHTDLIKDKLNILDVVGSYVTLEKAGKTWKGKSPFTNEKTASFFVDPVKGFFYCFSSGKGGDIFTFIQEIEKVDFRESLKILAEKAGVKLSDVGTSNLHSNLYKLLDDATKWYEVNLRKNKEAVDYLLQRGLNKESLVNFRIGFAIDSWSDIYTYLKKKKYTDDQIAQAGLITRKEKGNYYDRFRSRIMFPLYDSRGRVIGFSGRIFNEDPGNKGAKYVNSPEGPLFDKSKVLYGYHTAKSEISKKGFCIITEGQFDVLMAQQAGSVNTVAVSGTGLTDEHVGMIKRFADTIYLCFDSDKAGVNATKRSVLKAYEHAMKVKVIVLPFGRDPADIVLNSKEQWGIYVSDAQEYLDYRIQIFNEQCKDATFDDKHELVQKELFDFVYLITSSVRKDKVLQRLSLFLGVTHDAVRKDFDVYKPDGDVQVLPEHNHKQEQSEPKEHTQEELLAMYLFLEQEHKQELEVHQAKIRDQFKEIYGQNIKEYVDQIDPTLRSMFLFKYEQELKGLAFERILERLNLRLNHELIHVLKEQSKKLLILIRQSEHKKEQDKLRRLQELNSSLRKRIDQITNSN